MHTKKIADRKAVRNRSEICVIATAEKFAQRPLQTAETEKIKGVISREAIPSHKWVPQFFPGGTDLLIQTCQESDPSPVNYFRFCPDDMSRFNTMSLRKIDHLS